MQNGQCRVKKCQCDHGHAAEGIRCGNHSWSQPQRHLGIWHNKVQCIPFNRNVFVERFPKYLRNLGELRYCESCWPCTYLHDCMLVSCYVFLCGTDNCQRVDLTCCETLAKFIRNGYHLFNGTCNENQCNCQNGALGCKQWALTLDALTLD